MFKSIALLFIALLFIGGVFYISDFKNNNLAGEVIVRDIPPDSVIDYPLSNSVEEEYKVAVIMINVYNDKIIPSEPDTNYRQEFYSPEQLGEVFFNSPEGVNSFIQEASYGKVGLSGKVIGWFNLGEQDLDASEIIANKEEYISLASDYIDFNDYDIFYIVGKTKGEGAQVGWSMNNFIYESPQGKFENKGFDYLINSVFLTNTESSYLSSFILPSTSWAHEVLHTLGIGHALSLNCDDSIIADSCTFTPYGGVFSLMGEHAYSSHPNVFMKEKLGWLEESQIIEVEENGEYIIYPLETSGSNVKGLKILLQSPLTINSKAIGSDVNFDSLYIEYRIPKGFDKWLNRLDGSSFLGQYYNDEEASRNGPIIYLGYESQDVTSSMLLDMHPETSYNLEKGIKSKGNVGKFSDAILKLGETFYEVNNGISITPLEILDDGGMKIRITVKEGFDNLTKVAVPKNLVIDEFDFWEDQFSHNYQIGGIVLEGAYGINNGGFIKVCSKTGMCTNSALRIGSCSLGGGWASIDLSVEKNIDEFNLTILLSAYNKALGEIMNLSIDGEPINLGLEYPSFRSCIPAPSLQVKINNAKRFTEDGKITVNISDAYPSLCEGDPQVIKIGIYSKGEEFVFPTVIFSEEVDYSEGDSEDDGAGKIPLVEETEEVLEIEEINEEGTDYISSPSSREKNSPSSSESSSSSSSGGAEKNLNEEENDCETCFYEENCYKISGRFDNKYCSINKTIKNQKKNNNPCFYDYECLSNSCYLKECTDAPLIKQFTDWLRIILCNLKIIC